MKLRPIISLRVRSIMSILMSTQLRSKDRSTRWVTCRTDEENWFK